MQQIPGKIFTPCFMNEEDFENGYRNSIFWTEKDFFNEYRKHIAAMSHVAECAKIFILKNWEKVTDWSDLEVIIIHGPTGESTDYYNHTKHIARTERRKKRQEENNKSARKLPESLRKIHLEMEENDRARHNPIQSITNVVLDPSDGDFSLTVNGKEHWWIQDEAVIIIANHIENQLKNNPS
jgi:hypothetical protein